MIVRRFKINMIPGGKMAEVALSQYDSDVTLEFELYASDGTFVVESGTTAVFRGSKPDKNGISVAAELESIIDPETGKNIYLATVDVIPQMTAVAGRSLYELSLQKGGEELNTANFILDIERAPLDADTLPSESVIRELVDVIDKADEIIAAAEAVTTAIDDTLTQQGKAADAKKVGDEISDIKADLSELEPGLSDDAKTALLNCFEHVAWVDEHGQNYYNALANALYPAPASISAVFSPGQNKIYDTDSLDDLKQYLTVTGTYTDGSTREINDYVLSGTLAHGTSTVTVTKDDKTTTFNVTVEYLTVEWNYTDGIPTDNGFVQYSSAGTTQMTANGYSIVCDNVTDKSYRLYYPWSDIESLYTRAIIEWKFIIDAWGTYNAAPYMNGIRIAPGLGNRGGAVLNGPNFILNTSGLTSWHPKEGSPYYCEVLNAYSFEVGQEYTVKLELNTEECKIYVNGVLIATDAYEDFPETIKNCIWGVSRGASITVKSYKEQRGVS